METQGTANKMHASSRQFQGKLHFFFVTPTILTKNKIKGEKNCEGSLYVGITLKYDYINGTVDISIPAYVKGGLNKFIHPYPTRQ